MRNAFKDEIMQIVIRTTRIAPTLFNLFNFYPDKDVLILILILILRHGIGA